MSDFARRRHCFGRAFCILLLLYLGLWGNIYTGPWSLTRIQGTIGLFHAARAAALFLILPAALAFLFAASTSAPSAGWSGPAPLLFLYGAVALLSSVFSPAMSNSFYFGLSFFAAMAVGLAFQRQIRDAQALRLWVWSAWIVNLVFALLMIKMGWAYLSLENESAYGILNAGRESSGIIPMSRASGVGRLAAVPAIVALARLWGGRGWRKWLWLAPMLFFFYVVYKVQSRGAIIASIVSIGLVLLADRGRIKALALGFVALMVVMAVDPDMTILHRFEEHLRRGQSREELTGMTGRTRDWKTAIEVFWHSPIVLGYGNWADRYFINQHVHNAYLQALLYGGLAGFLLYIASWAAAWRMFLRILAWRESLPPQDRQMFLEVSAVMMFFFMRSIPETTSASFSVDLLVMLPVFVYLEHLYVSVRAGAFARAGAHAAPEARVVLRPIGAA